MRVVPLLLALLAGLLLPACSVKKLKRTLTPAERAAALDERSSFL